MPRRIGGIVRLLCSLALLHAAARSAWSDNLWVESSSSDPFPELELTALPLNRTTWRLLREKKVQVKVDGRPALLLSMKPVRTPPEIFLLLDRSDPALGRARELGELWKGFLDSLDPATRVRAYLLGSRVETLGDAALPPRKVLPATRSIPHEGAAAALRRGLERALADARESKAGRRVLILLSLTRDPTLTDAARIRADLVDELDDLDLPVVALSLGSDTDRALMRRLGESRGGMSIHSWSIRNLRSALVRLSAGLRRTFRMRVQSPLHEEDGSLRTVEVRALGRKRKLLARSRIRLPGEPAPLPATPEPSAPPPGAAPPPPVPRPLPPGPPRSSKPRRKAPDALPHFHLGDWPVQGKRPAERELTTLVSVQLGVLHSHADAVLRPAIEGVRIAVENRDRALATRLYRRARVCFAYLGNTYGKTTVLIERMLDEHAALRDADAAFLRTQRERLGAVRAGWQRYKSALKGWEENLARVPEP